MLGAIDHGVVMGCAARKSQKPALEIGGWAGGAQVPCFCLQVCADNGEVWGGYGGRVRSVALATTRGCSAFHPLVFAGLAAPHLTSRRRRTMSAALDRSAAIGQRAITISAGWARGGPC